MSDLRAKLVRLAHQHPEFRDDLLPLVKDAGYGRGGNDPRWLAAKRPGEDNKGRPFKKGDRILYWPSTKTIMTGVEAEKEWRDYLSNVGDEEGNPYARSAAKLAGFHMDEGMMKQALAALNLVAEGAKLPVRFTRVTQTELKVPTPKGFNSLLREVMIEVQWSSNGQSAQIRWSYRHPTGSNGYTIGSIAWNEGGQNWRYSIDSTRESGHTGSADMY